MITQYDRLKSNLDSDADRLMDDFFKFYIEEKTNNPIFTKADIFEPWAIQRISNLEMMLTQTVERINQLEDKLKHFNASH